ncbi:adenosine kinase [Gammaproteobacteria bacterium]|nr:adenosine kinase [Gammaproteobacteria bacterium]MDA7802276.1 adenosine kinase [Gammaproteobacteria bacterium]MDA7856345.1 adenosine kinase [Gammaproteobacteria bacterium]MDA9010708.1 adenosine kinase [Gammaproteobacteria bacterium]MDA9038597.1 adenosine kinase [Gammaproteobacteria bacterium]|tara:strand:+ start:4559 stop:5560 length:1002 start_codon:yes stop_codon:yes gene_type:complete
MQYDISALGNALVDTQFMVDYKFLEEFGLEANQMVLVSAEDQKPILEKLQSLSYESVSDCGGSATNSLVAASNYGSKCHHVCRVADDKDGNMYIKSLKQAGVAHIGISDRNGNLPTGKCLILVTPDAKRTMISMLGVSEFLGKEDIDYGVVENSKIFYIEGYMVTSEDNFNAVISVLEHLKGKNIIKALSLADAGLVKIFKERFNKIESYGIDLIFCNDDEAIAFSETQSIDKAISFFKEKNYITAITKGADGSSVVSNGEEISAPAKKIEPIDTNGAGDMFAGSFMHAYLKGYNLSECSSFANYASSLVVTTFGPRVPNNKYKEILNKLRKS